MKYVLVDPLDRDDFERHMLGRHALNHDRCAERHEARLLVVDRVEATALLVGMQVDQCIDAGLADQVIRDIARRGRAKGCKGQYNENSSGGRPPVEPTVLVASLHRQAPILFNSVGAEPSVRPAYGPQRA